MSKNRNLAGGLFSGEPLNERETSLSARIAEYCAKAGIYQVRMNSGTIVVGKRAIHLAPRGTPDRFLCVKGQLIAVEVKRPGEKTTPDQCKQHARLRAAGAQVLVIATVEELHDTLSNL